MPLPLLLPLTYDPFRLRKRMLRLSALAPGPMVPELLPEPACPNPTSRTEFLPVVFLPVCFALGHFLSLSSLFGLFLVARLTLTGRLVRLDCFGPEVLLWFVGPLVSGPVASVRFSLQDFR